MSARTLYSTRDHPVYGGEPGIYETLQPQDTGAAASELVRDAFTMALIPILEDESRKFPQLGKI